MKYLAVLIVWSFVLYWAHRLAHILPWIKNTHLTHYWYIANHRTSWHWSNLFLFNDSLVCTIDYWTTEVLPTILVAWLFNAPWLLLLYYIWAAVIQETLEHNKSFNWYPFTSGQWHMVHHTLMNKNFGIFIPIWDRIFKTEYWDVKVNKDLLS